MAGGGVPDGSRDLTLQVVAARADATPDRPFVQEVGGPELSYGEFHRNCLLWADVLDHVGVAASDAVISTVGGAAGFWSWFGAGWLGAVHVPIDPELRDRMLVAALRTTGASVAVVEPDGVEHLVEIAAEVPQLRLVLVIGADSAIDADIGGVSVLAAGPLAEAANPTPRPVPDPSSAQAGIFTSGTTGPAKCAVRNWAGFEHSSRWLFPGDLDGVTPGGGYYATWPLHHGLGLSGLGAAVRRELRLVVRRKFSASSFWADIDSYGCTHSVLLIVAPILARQPRSPADRRHPLRHVTMVPLFSGVAEFAERFGVHVGTIYGQTETGTTIAIGAPGDHRAAGRPVQGYEARIETADGRLAADGEVGELVVRPDDPALIAGRYLGRPEAMGAKWRGGWFHTGDAFSRDHDGTYRFVDRLDDCMRHRGHNVSSTELERELLRCPGVAEAACIGVPSDLADTDTFGDQDLVAYLVLEEGASIDEAALIENVSARVPSYMVPRYVVVVDDLPRTITHKVRKVELRRLWSEATAWDRTALPSI